MARTDGRDAERWPEVRPSERWAEAVEEPRWPQPEQEGRWAEAQSARRRTGQLRVELPPIVNPYSVIALVAALIGLFPVAVVFGLIAFSRPRSRVMAMFAVLLGLVEVLVLAAFVGNFLPGSVSLADRTLSVSTATVPTGAATTMVPTIAAPPPPVTTASPPPAGDLSALTKGTPCTQAQVGLIGAATDGSTLLCLATTETSNYQWSGPYTVASTIQEIGTRCTTGGARTARGADGHALVCEGGAWTLWSTE